jgi:hypothetical protein
MPRLRKQQRAATTNRNLDSFSYRQSQRKNDDDDEEDERNTQQPRNQKTETNNNKITHTDIVLGTHYLPQHTHTHKLYLHLYLVRLLVFYIISPSDNVYIGIVFIQQ